MGSVYTVAKLPADKVDQAFPLIRALEPHLDLERWREMCAAMDAEDVAGARTVLVVSAPTGHFRALCIVEVRRSPNVGPAVAISRLFIDNVLEPDRVAGAMLDSLAAYGKAHGCSRLQIAIRGTDEAAIAEMKNVGANPHDASIAIELL